MTDSAKRLAITIMGGVSLGAYEAGVITEVLALLAYNNTNGGTPWYIDVLGGASAGSITALMLVVALIDKNKVGLLKDMWTDELSLDALSTNAPANTLLDSSAVEQLALRILGSPPTPNPHPALRPKLGRIGLTLTLSAFSGNLQQVLTAQGSLFKFADLAEEARFDVTVRGGQVAYVSHGTGAFSLANAAAKHGDLQGSDAFDALRETAVTSAAFPFAFAPRILNRWVTGDGAWMKRAFVDGGVYDNEPVGKTIDLAHDLDWDATNPAYDDRDRRFLIVTPEPMPTPGPDLPQTSTIAPPNLVNMKLLDFVGVLVPEMLGQLTGSGLTGIEQINRAIADRTQVLSNLEYTLHTTGGSINFDRNVLNTLVAAAAKVRNLDSRLQLFQDNFISDLRDTDQALWGAARALPDDRRQIFTSLGLLIDFAANLADKVRFQPIVVAPEKPLSGDPFHGFAGFFLDEIRVSDFVRGMKDAYETWSREREVTDPEFKIDPSPQFPSDPLPVGWRNNALLRGRYDAAQQRFEKRIDTVMSAGIFGTVFGPILGNVLPFGYLLSQFLS